MTKSSFACGLALCAMVAAYSSVPKADPAATATPASTAAAPAAATAASKTPKLVCENVSEEGSHLKKRVCLTPEQIAQRHKDSQDAARDLQNRAQPLSSESKPPA